MTKTSSVPLGGGDVMTQMENGNSTLSPDQLHTVLVRSKNVEGCSKLGHSIYLRFVSDLKLSNIDNWVCVVGSRSSYMLITLGWMNNCFIVVFRGEY